MFFNRDCGQSTDKIFLSYSLYERLISPNHPHIMNIFYLYSLTKNLFKYLFNTDTKLEASLAL